MVIQSRGQGEGIDIIQNQERHKDAFVPFIQPALIQTQHDDIKITGLWLKKKKKSDDRSGKLRLENNPI